MRFVKVLSLVKQCDRTGEEIVNTTEHFDLAILDAGSQDRVQSLEHIDSGLDILADCVFQLIAGHSFTSCNGWFDEFDHAIYSARQGVFILEVLNGSFDGTATAVPEDQDEGHVQFDDRIFYAALHGHPRSTDNVTGHPHHEDVADADIEEDLRRNPGVSTSNDYGLGKLPVRQRPKILRPPSRRQPFSGHETVVAVKQFTQGLVWV
jgi:hypothetical protein